MDAFIISGETYCLILINNNPQDIENNVIKINFMNGCMRIHANEIIRINWKIINNMKYKFLSKSVVFTLNAIINVIINWKIKFEKIWSKKNFFLLSIVDNLFMYILYIYIYTVLQFYHNYNILLKKYFNDTFNNNSRRPMAAAGEARPRKFIVKNNFLLLFFNNGF